MSTSSIFLGTWRIVDMELWDQEAFDDVGPAHITIDKDGFGRFRFVAVEGRMDCRFVERDGKPAVEFSWLGCDDRDDTSGRGWAVVDGDLMVGRIFIHCADDSAFTARRHDAIESKSPRRKRSR